MRVGAIIQARMGSTRLPGKVLMDIAGETMLARVVNRVRRMGGLDEVIVATTALPEDEAIVRECGALGVPVIRGSADDVLDRYVQAARAFLLDVVVRITADCPLIDPEVSGGVLRRFLEALPDYASNTLCRTYPRGLDTEVMGARALERAWKEAHQPYEREHVSPYLYEHPDLFHLLSVKDAKAGATDAGRQRWTVDTIEDLEFIRAVYARVPANKVGWLGIYDIIRLEPHLVSINSHVRQKVLKSDCR